MGSALPPAPCLLTVLFFEASTLAYVGAEFPPTPWLTTFLFFEASTAPYFGTALPPAATWAQDAALMVTKAAAIAAVNSLLFIAFLFLSACPFWRTAFRSIP